MASLAHLLRAVTVSEMIAALKKDGFTQPRGNIWAHPDGRMTVVHVHSGSDTFKPKTLGSILDATGWTEDDARRLKLLK